MCGTMIIKSDKTMTTMNTHFGLLRGMNEPIIHSLSVSVLIFNGSLFIANTTTKLFLSITDNKCSALVL